MSDAKHTPGPWGIEQTESSNWIGRMRLDGSGKVSELVTSTDRAHLKPEALARNDANARLIAAAPELLETLRVLVAHLDRYDLNCCFQEENETNHLVEVARDVIAKATEAAV